MRRLRRHFVFLAALLTVGVPPNASAAEHKGITIAAAMSLRDTMPRMVEAFRKQSGAPEITITYGASGKLRRQVEAGAPIDAVIFASSSHIERLINDGLVDANSRRVVATNSLVLVGPSDAKPLTFSTIDLISANDLIAIGDPESVPAGRYARDALRSLHKWEAIQSQLIFAGHVAAALQYARRGEVAAAVVYDTDVRDPSGVTILDRAQGAWAPAIETVAAVVEGGSQPTAQAFVDFMASATGQGIFAANGFGRIQSAQAANTP